MHSYALSLQKHFNQHANPNAAGPMKAYMRNQFEYLGIKSPEQSALMKQFIVQNGLPLINELDQIVRDLWALDEREYQYASLGLISRSSKGLQPEFIKTLEFLITTKSWWDTVDSTASNIVGPLFRRYPLAREKYLARWRKSDNMWLRRTTILFQLGYKQETDFPLMCEIIRENLGSKEFFINKAIGWALRQYTRVDPQGVCDFVAATPLHPLSAREALKWLENQKH